MKKPKISLNSFQGQKVVIATEQIIALQGETGEIEQMPLIHQGIFIFSDDRDIYLNTVDEDPTTFNIVINRNSYASIEVVANEPVDKVDFNPTVN